VWLCGSISTHEETLWHSESKEDPVSSITKCPGLIVCVLHKIPVSKTVFLYPMQSTSCPVPTSVSKTLALPKPNFIKRTSGDPSELLKFIFSCHKIRSGTSDPYVYMHYAMC
jgi:hypothetical protein